MSNKTYEFAKFVRLATSERREIEASPDVYISVDPTQCVVAGEYADEPDVYITINAAVDEDGSDIREYIAKVIVHALQGLAPRDV